MNRSNLLVLSLAVLATALITYVFLGRSRDRAPVSSVNSTARVSPVMSPTAAEHPALAPQNPIGSVVGSIPHSHATLLSLRRTGPTVVAAKLSMSLDRQAPEEWMPSLQGADGTAYTAEGLRLVDEVNGREHFPLQETDGHCLCSTDIGFVEPGDTIGVSAMFPAPPATVQRMSLHVPGFPSFDDVPLQQ